MKKYSLVIAFFLLISLAQNTKAQTIVRFYTTMGNFDAQLYDVLQPITTTNFRNLVSNKFYDTILFHRVVAGFVIQGGDPTGTGSGGSGVTIPDEFDPATHNVQKAIAMANSGPNTGTSQFFINLVDNLGLDAGYPVFGIVTTSFNVVQNIGAVAVDANDRPLVNVRMDSVRIISSPVGVANQVQPGDLMMELYPNPASSTSVLSIQSPVAQNVEVSVYNMVGTRISLNPVKLNAGITRIPLSQVSNALHKTGIYIIHINDKNSSCHQRVMIGSDY